MAVIVQKFGGSSVADVTKMRRCAQWVLRARDAGQGVVVVVSAMGKTTDRLVELAGEAWADAPAGLDGIPAGPPRRELDVLLASGEQVSASVFAMVLESMGAPATSVLASQIGMRTDPDHTRARIESLDARVVDRLLGEGRVVVAAGFQGVTEEGDITTLGRGGSDTTAVAIAAAVGAEACEIYTDVDGVYTADPRRVPTARRRDWVSYEAMLEMASLGAKVLHPRAVLFGARYGVPIHVLHSQRDVPGTLISKEFEGMERIEVTGVVLKEDLGRVTLTGLPNEPGVVARLFADLAAAGVVVDDIIQTVETAGQGAADDRSATVSFTVDHADLAEVRPVLDTALDKIGGGRAAIDVGFCKVSAAGVGVRSHAPIAARMFEALAAAGINIANITTSEIKVSVILDAADADRALPIVHDAFELGEGQR